MSQYGKSTNLMSISLKRQEHSMRFLKLDESTFINIDSINEIFFSTSCIIFYLKYNQHDSSPESLQVGVGDHYDITISEKELQKLKSDVRLLCN